MGKRNYFKMSSEDERQLILDIAQVISGYENEGASMGAIQEEIEKKYQGINVTPFVKGKLTTCLGKISKGDRRWTRYVIDDLDIACQLINQYYDNGMSELDVWKLRKSICKYIDENPGVTTDKVCDEFSIDEEFIDKMNSELIKYNVGIDFYKETSKGTKMRINNDLTISAVSGIINDIESKYEKKSKVDKVVDKSEKKLSDLDINTKRSAQLRLIEIIYRESSISEYDIAKMYLRLNGNNITFPTIRSMRSSRSI